MTSSGYNWYIAYQMVSDRDIPYGIFMSECDAIESCAIDEHMRYYRMLPVDIDTLDCWYGIVNHRSLE